MKMRITTIEKRLKDIKKRSQSKRSNKHILLDDIQNYKLETVDHLIGESINFAHNRISMEEYQNEQKRINNLLNEFEKIKGKLEASL